MRFTGKYLLFLDRCFRIPYRAAEALLKVFQKDPVDQTGQILVIKFMGMGSIIRFASLCEEYQVNKDKITLITLSQHRELCGVLGFKDGWFIRSGAVSFFLDTLKCLLRARTLRPSLIIDFERCSQAVGLYRTTLAWWGHCKTISFDYNRKVLTGNHHVYPVNDINLRELFLKGIEWMPKSSKPHASRKVPIRTKKILININASPYLLARRYSIDSFADVIRGLHRWNSNLEFYLTGSKQETKYVDILIEKLLGLPVTNVAGEWNFSKLTDALECCSLFITGDSGPLHLAVYLNVPAIAIWGPTQPQHFGYRDEHNLHHITENLTCSPCFKHPASSPAVACGGKIDCLTHLAPSSVVQKAIQILGKPVKTTHPLLVVADQELTNVVN